MQSSGHTEGTDTDQDATTALEVIPTIATDLWDADKLDLMRNISLSRISSRKESMRETRESLLQKYNELSREELTELAVNFELHSIELEDENYALVEQINQCQRDIVSLQADFTRLKKNHIAQISELKEAKEKSQALAAERETEIIFLEDHARFSAEQTKLSISHWDMLLRNRDENIELLTKRISAISAASALSETITLDSYRCLKDRVKGLATECNSLRKQLNISVSDEEEGNLEECPWRHQADVRVAQLERVTSQLNATYAQLHAKSDELLLQNRELGNLRKKSFQYESRIRKYRTRISSLQDKLSRPSPSIPTTESSSIQSSE